MLNKDFQIFRKLFKKIFIQKYKLLVDENHYIVRVLENFVERDGKRIRPYLMLLSSGLSVKDVKNSAHSFWDFAVGIELIHAGMLVHDDIMDGDTMRRGRPTVHRIIAEPNAIVLGDAAWSLGFLSMMRANLPQLKKEKIIAEFVRATICTCIGQALDMDYLKKKKLRLADLMQMYALKTAMYSVQAPLIMGALLGGKNKYINAYRSLGMKLGILFQLQDDILDAKDDKKRFLKKVNADILLEKSGLISSTRRAIYKSILPPKEKNMLLDIVLYFDNLTK